MFSNISNIFQNTERFEERAAKLEGSDGGEGCEIEFGRFLIRKPMN